ncbi:hypothetical protein ACQP00_21425 [Dactylosporangium sp. CS-047395]|uniref:hypothetical protein n=1 Tax=Dactylosporangium sp. CS-047395 TaxID=3239936 RepID=UPI003D904C62
MLFVVRNRTTAGYQVIEGEPKTAAGRRAVALDRRTVKVLREHRRRQAQQRERRLAAGKVWRDSGYVFVGKEGNPIHPGYASGWFRLLVKRVGVPPVRLHDLRHGAVPSPQSRCGPQDAAGPARALQHRDHRRHLHQRPPARPAQVRRRHREARPRCRPPYPREDPRQEPPEPAPPANRERCADPGTTDQRQEVSGHTPTDQDGVTERDDTTVAPAWHQPSTADRNNEAVVPRFRRSTAS